MRPSRNMRIGIRRYGIALILLVIPGRLCAQPPAGPGGGGQAIPSAAADTLDALADTPGLSINTAPGCCEHPTIWDFLGAKQIAQHHANSSKALHELPLIKGLSAAFTPVLQGMGLAPPPETPGPTPAPGAGGPGGAGGGADGAGAVAAKIEADKAAAEATIQNLTYLAAQDCNRYPEVVPAILQELDNPDELVRYTAITALRKQCKDFRCSTLPATRIFFRLRHSRFGKACGCCNGCECQEQVIVRLTDLLLDRDALGRPKEKSTRIREFAAEILRECVRNRGRDAKQTKQQVEPDPERGPLPDPEPAPPPPAPAARRLFPGFGASSLKPVDLSPAHRLMAVPGSSSKQIEQAIASGSPEPVVNSLRSRQGTPSAIQLTAHETSSPAQPVRQRQRRSAGSTATGSKPMSSRAAAAAAEQRQIVEEAENTLELHQSAESEQDQNAYQDAFSRRCLARLKLAMLGDQEQETLLLEDAERLCQEQSSSPQAVIAVASVCRLAELKVEQPSADVRQWLQRRARLLTYAARYFSHDTDIAANHLLTTAAQCREHDLLDAQQACLQSVVDWFPQSSAAMSARQQLADQARETALRQMPPPVPPPGFERHRDVTPDVETRDYSNTPAPPQRTTLFAQPPPAAAQLRSAPVPAAPVVRPPEVQTAANVTPEVHATANGPAEITPPSDHRAVQDPAEQRPAESTEPQTSAVAAATTTAEDPIRTADLAQELPQSSYFNSTFELAPFSAPADDWTEDDWGVTGVDSPADPHHLASQQTLHDNPFFTMQLPPPDGVDVAVTGLTPLPEPYFSTKPLTADVYDRAFKALNVNHEAMAFPEASADDLAPYNNRVAIDLASFSMYTIDNAQPGNVLRLRFRSVRGYDRPFRSEYFWARNAVRGPLLPETGLNFQDFVFYNETGSDTTSVFTEIPVRLLNPEMNANTAGPGDMVIGLKSILINDPNYRISSITRTTTPVGVSRRGLGTAFLSIEQGLLAIWRIGRSTHLHGEVKFRYPIAADPVFGGEVVRTGIGVSRVLWSDVITPPQPTERGLILTAEVLFTSFLDGLDTSPTGTILDAEGTAINQHVGLRRMWSKRFSSGIDFGFSTADDRLYNFSMITDLQWLY